MAGTFVLSLDTELAWGTFDKGGHRAFRQHLESTREKISSLLTLLHDRQIPATWAFVGHLFLNECSPSEDGQDPHPDVKTPRFSWYDRPWHGEDPATDRKTSPLWYGDDILDMVLEATPEHEIGCHTFSHVPLGDPAVDSETARSQLAKCCELAQERNITLRSLAFPRNNIGHFPIVKELGFTSYRGPERSWFTRLPGRMAQLGHFAHRFLAITPPVYQSLPVESGLVNIPASMFLMPPDGIRALIPGRSRIMQAKRGLHAGAKTDSVFHLWFHPWNLGGSSAMLTWLEEILDEVATLRSQGKMRVLTMGNLASEVLANERDDLRPRN